MKQYKALFYVFICLVEARFRLPKPRFTKNQEQKSRQFWPNVDGMLDRDDGLPISSSSPPSSNNGFWPPWPFSEFISSKSTPTAASNNVECSSHNHPTVWHSLWTISKQTYKHSVRNIQEYGSQMWFHLPPAAPPLMLLSLWPRSQTVTGADNQKTVRKVIPLFQNGYVRTLALSGMALCVMSWAHSELKRKKLMTPIIYHQARIHGSSLPPFLPDQVSTVRGLEVLQTNDDDGDSNKEVDLLSIQWKDLWSQEPHHHQSWTRTWNRFWERRQLQRAEKHNAHRLAVYDELIALQQRKQTIRKRPYLKNNYALVTGASKGIGRAIAVELARWDVPLILIARDLSALVDLAYDIETCYGVNCVVLSADLAQPNAPERIYETIQKAGLQVDILVNNAGFSSYGPVLNHPLSDMKRMVQVNAISSMSLTHLFGKDMRERRRGRILMVSSICGAVSGIATVATYSATKAFENSFSISLAKEMEPYGVGVTCLMPGAVKGTEFRSQSKSEEALCWKLPFYAKTAPGVAEWGVRSMLLGETECTPGILNRLFVKVIKPIAPQRLHNLVSEVMWNPLHLPFLNSTDVGQQESVEIVDAEPTMPRLRPSRVRPPSSAFSKSPRVLKLEEIVPDADGIGFIEPDETEALRQEVLNLREQLNAAKQQEANIFEQEVFEGISPSQPEFESPVEEEGDDDSEAFRMSNNLDRPENEPPGDIGHETPEHEIEGANEADRMQPVHPAPSPEPDRSSPPIHGESSSVPEYDTDLEIFLKDDRQGWPSGFFQG